MPDVACGWVLLQVGEEPLNKKEVVALRAELRSPGAKAELLARAQSPVSVFSTDATAAAAVCFPSVRAHAALLGMTFATSRLPAGSLQQRRCLGLLCNCSC
jgi:hypothetical protein